MDPLTAANIDIADLPPLRSITGRGHLTFEYEGRRAIKIVAHDGYDGPMPSIVDGKVVLPSPNVFADARRRAARGRQTWDIAHTSPIDENQPRIDLSHWFGKVVAINLDSRPDRWKEFNDRLDKLPGGWPFARPERIAAVNGQQTNPPSWWADGRNAYGCWMSHLQCAQSALESNPDAPPNLLVLEDDAMFRHGFARHAAAFLETLPSDWHMAYLGGQHRAAPQKVNPRVVRASKVNRTHAMAIRGSFLKDYIAWLTDWEAVKNRRALGHKCHIDFWLEQMQATGRWNIYAPCAFLIGQGGGKSDINGEKKGAYWFNQHASSVLPGDVMMPQHKAAEGLGTNSIKPSDPILVVKEPSVHVKRVVLFKSYADNVFPDCIEPYFKRIGWTFELSRDWRSWADAGKGVRQIHSADLVLIWHGSEPGGDWLKRVCRGADVPYLVVENGLLPQSGYFHIDPAGIVGMSSLKGDLSWVTPEDLSKAREHCERHFAMKGWKYKGGGGYVLCPLQLPHDASIYMDAPPKLKTMQAFIDHVREIRPDKPIIVTPHPRWKGAGVTGQNVAVQKDKSTMELAQHADEMIVLTSTVAYEAAALGCPVTALGDCPIRSHTTAEARERLIAAAHARQIPRQATDLTPWLERLGVAL